MLKEVFISLVSNYSSDQEYIALLWAKIAKKHTQKSRSYHNLAHLENIYQQLLKIKSNLMDWDIILFTMFYHDYIYNALKKDNEDQSAEVATKVLLSLSMQKDRITLCNKTILATKGHNDSDNSDINYFTDADLSILGDNWFAYNKYYQEVRKEYKYYPDFIYKKGRIQVLNQFLSMPRIFKTDYFYHQLEKQARNNMQKEIDILTP